MATTHRIEGFVEQPRDFWRVPSTAEEYERQRFRSLWGRFYRWREERTIQKALRQVRPGSAVLDAACGTGRVTALLRRMGFAATGCDISLAMMSVARQKLTALGHDVSFVASDAQHLPYAKESFDSATCIGLLMHLDGNARLAVLRQLAAITRDRVVVQYGCVQVFNRVRYLITGHPPGNVRYPISEAQMRADLAQVGLRELSRFWVVRGLSSSVVIVATKQGSQRVTA
jgi:ubiquinone/menaquinone biosynthesis C-methylase UbiE